MQKPQILILGAGISGLTTALLLLEKGYKVDIWSKEFSPNTTSDTSAAFWYPYLAPKNPNFNEWARIGYKKFLELLDEPRAGIRMRTGHEFFHKELPDPWWSGDIRNFRRPTDKELPQGYVDGYIFDTPVIDMGLYMPYLQLEVQNAGGVFLKKEIHTIETETEHYEYIVNTTGLGSRELCHDEHLHPIRGQILKVKGMSTPHLMVHEYTYIVPRENDHVLGGTAYKNDENTNPSLDDTLDILRRCREIQPDVQNVKKIDTVVGLRPARFEVRLEEETLSNGKKVFHNYGHGGSGVTLSWGCASDVVKKIEEGI